MADRDRLRAAFDSAARQYHQARPGYPKGLYDELIRLVGLRPGDRLLQVGCGTGMATVPLARRGFQITCVKIGAGLAAEARRNLAGFPRVEVTQAAFETWRPLRTAVFDLVFAATAWHWIDPTPKYRRAWELLRPGGHLSFWSAAHVFPAGGGPFFRDIQDVYEEIGEGLPPGAACPRPGELADDRAEIEASGLFGPRSGVPVRLGSQLHRRAVPPHAGHLLRPYRHGHVETGPVVRRDPAPAGRPSRRTRAAALGRGAARCPASRQP
jgi:SAM-dependent methyltransferase